MIYNKVYQFLSELQLEKYWPIFNARGFDREDDLLELDVKDLDSMAMNNIDGKLILEAGTQAFGIITQLLIYNYYF